MIKINEEELRNNISEIKGSVEDFEYSYESFIKAKELLEDGETEKVLPNIIEQLNIIEDNFKNFVEEMNNLSDFISSATDTMVETDEQIKEGINKI